MAEDERLADSIRLLDPEILPQTYTQLQQVRGFYGFGEKLDVVRYESGTGDPVDYVVGARQISDADLTQQQQQWQNRHSYYSHGFGLVGAPASEVVCNGQPYFVSGFLGAPEEEGGPEVVGGERCRAPTDIPQLAAEQPRIYYGDGMSDYVIVGGVDEFDRPQSGGGEVTYRYTGEGGVEVGSFWRKLLYAIKFRESNFVLSEIVNPESKVIYEREPRQRVEKVAPFLTVDGDPYPAVVDGRIVWIVDAYTTATNFPYAQRIDLQTETQDAQVGAGGVAQLAQEEISYMRNSVKATVDAYDGTVTLYEFDDEDPVLQAWNEAFGGDLVVPKEETPASLVPHFRYPIDMFKVQRNLLQRFYVENPGEFFAGTDFWEVPNTPANPDSPFRQPPYYLLAQFPGQEQPTFQLTSALSPVDRFNLASLVSGAFVDGELRLQAWTLPDDTRIPGPVQVHQFMTNASAVRSELTLLEAGGSARVEFGNLLSLPYEDGMLYVEPVYVRTTATDAYPLLQKVLMSYGQYVTLADSVEEGLADLVEQGERGIPTLPDEPPPAEGEAQPPPTTPPAEPPEPTTPPATEEPPPDLAEAQAAMEEAEQELADAYDSGDFARIAEALQQWYEARQALEAAGGSRPPRSPRRSGSPVNALPGRRVSALPGGGSAPYEGGAKHRRQALGELLLGPAPLDQQALQHVERHERPEHVGGGVYRPRWRQPALGLEPGRQGAAVVMPVPGNQLPVRSGVRVAVLGALQRPSDRDQPGVVAGQVLGPLHQRLLAVWGVGDRADRPGQVLGLVDVREQRGDQFGARGEVQVDRAAGDAGALCYRAHGEAGQALRLDQGAGRGE